MKQRKKRMMVMLGVLMLELAILGIMMLKMKELGMEVSILL